MEGQRNFNPREFHSQLWLPTGIELQTSVVTSEVLPHGYHRHTNWENKTFDTLKV